MVVIALFGMAMLAASNGSAASPATAVSVASPAHQIVAQEVAAGSPGWVAVSVATLWRTPGSVRAVDQPALERPARIRAWLAAMSLAQRRDLGGRADTQALLGDRVRVLPDPRVLGQSRGSGPAHPTGHPGLPGLGADPPAHGAATHDHRPDRHGDPPDGLAARRRRHREEAVPAPSSGTRLPYLGEVGRSVRVRTPLGVVRRIRGAGVSVHAPADPALPQSRGGLVRTAQLFHGLPYLWAGASGFGLDCSGLVWLDHRAHGIVTPRDSAAQAMHGARVKRANLRRGDLMFYATNGAVHHVTMYAGRQRMVQAPHTGSVVETCHFRG